MSDKNFRVRHGLEVDGPATIAGTATADGADIGNITVAVTNDNTITTTSGNLAITAAAGSAVTITSENTAPTTISRNTTSNNVTVRSLSLDVQSSGTPAVGFGNTLDWQVEAQPGNTERGGFIAVNLTDITPGSEDFEMRFGLMENGAAYATKMSLDSTGSLDLDNNLTVGGTTVGLAQGTTIEYSENNNRLNRPIVKSTSGNTSGLRIEAPNATASAVAVSSVFNTNDPNNGKFINIRADGSAGPISIRTGQYVAGVFGASGNSIDIYDGNTKYATINPAGPTITTDLVDKAYVDALPANITYTIDASSTTGGANFNLVGSDSTTDTVKFASGTGVTVSQTNASEIGIAIGQPVATTDAVTFASVSANGVDVGLSANTISSTALSIDGEAVGGGSVTVNATDTSPGSGAGQLTIDTSALTYTHTDGALVPGVTGTWSFNPSGTTSFPSYTFPYADGTSNQLLKTDGSGNLSWFTPTDANTTYTIDASSTTGGANFNLVGSDATTDTIKFAGSGATTVTQTSANEITISSTDNNTTYTIDASSTTGGANLNLVGSDSTTDTVKFASGTGVTVSQTSANEMSIAIGQAVGTGDSPSFLGVTAGNLTVGVATDNTIASTNTNGNIVLTPNGTGVAIFDSITRLRGESQATTNNSYVFPASALTSVTDNNGYSAASSFGTTGNGYQANAQYINYTADTRAGSNAAASLNFRQANGNSVAGVNIPWTGVNSVAASASLTNDVLGTSNYNGYATTGFTNDIATMYQGGGIATSHIAQIQGFAAENIADGTKTLTSADITAVASSFRAALGAPQVTGTKGQISFNATTPGVGNAIRVTGTLTGTATGIVSGNTYYIIVTNGSTTATLSDTPNGQPITTTAGTLTGLTLTRCGVTFTIANQTSFPFGRNALVTVSGVNNVTDGTYPVGGAVTSLTSISLGIPHTVAPTLSGTQQFTCPTVTNAGGGWRVRSNVLATPLNPSNRLELVNHTAASATYRADSFVVAGGAYANTGATYLTLNNTDATFTKPIKWSGSTSGTVQISAPAVAGTQTYTLPTAQPTANNQILVSTTGGVMSWVSTNSLAANYLDANWTTAIGTLTANTIYGVPLTSLSATNITIATGAIAIDNATATGPTRITFAQTGRYNLQFSIQIANSDTAEQDLDVWLRKNGTDVADTNTQITVPKQQGGLAGKNIMALNLLLNVTVANDYYELVYATTDADCKPETIAGISTPYVRPQAPAVIVTVVPIGA